MGHMRDADVERLRRFGGRARDLSFLAAGEWSTAYGFVLDGREAVVRVGRHVDDFAKDRVMGGFSTRILPIPRVLEIGEAECGCYAVSERVHGRPIDEVGAEDMRALLPRLLEALQALGALSLPGRSGFGLWRADGAAPSRTWAGALLAAPDPQRMPGWRQRLDASPEEAGLFDAGLERLHGLASSLPDVQRIVHGDLLNRNVLTEGDRISGVIDWGNALLGDPLYDIAWLWYWWPWYPAWRGVDLPEFLDRHWAHGDSGPPDWPARLRPYLIHIGLAHVAYCAFRGRTADLRRNARQLKSYL